MIEFTINICVPLLKIIIKSNSMSQLSLIIIYFIKRALFLRPSVTSDNIGKRGDESSFVFIGAPCVSLLLRKRSTNHQLYKWTLVHYINGRRVTWIRRESFRSTLNFAAEDPIHIKFCNCIEFYTTYMHTTSWSIII